MDRTPLAKVAVSHPRPDPARSAGGHPAAGPRPAADAAPGTHLDRVARAQRRRARRAATLGVVLLAAANAVSALTPPLRARLQLVHRYLPLEVSRGAAATSAYVAFALLGLAWGLRRGQARAYGATIGLLVLGVLTHLAKGFDTELAAANALVCGFLLVNRRHFRAPAAPFTARRVVRLAALTLGLSVAGGVLAAEAFAVHRHPRLTVAAGAALRRSMGGAPIEFATGPARLVGLVLPFVGVGLGVLVGLAWTRPAPPPRTTADARARTRARLAHAGDSLSYFALRDDKRLFEHGDGVVAYAVMHGVALVSPDPIAPDGRRHDLWRAFREFADDHGWAVAVLGASAGWLDVYEADGMSSMYLGDEALVDVQSFRIDVPGFKSLRQAVNRVARHGHFVSFHDPSRCDPALQAQLLAMAGDTRRGERERGFSMTLGRLFDPDDTDLLLAVCHDAGGTAVGFCQFVPAPALGGWSLDLMRRSAAAQPNGVMDFVLVRTIEELRTRGARTLALNFAALRAVVANEAAPSAAASAQRVLCDRLGKHMQIESLWRYNAKFAPSWQPRYAVWDGAESLPATSVAMARAESLTELPVVGRWLRGAPSPA